MSDILTVKDQQLKDQDYIKFYDHELLHLRNDQVQHIVEYFRGYTMMRLPDSEIAFFEWLRQNDPAVWDDLWSEEEDRYLVSVDFLYQFTGRSNGFPICDLIDEPNFWFSDRHIKPKGAEKMEQVILKLQNQRPLDKDELFLYELTVAPIDIWHFCYRHNLAIDEMKEEIEAMVSKGWIVHLTDREDLARYVEI